MTAFGSYHCPSLPAIPWILPPMEAMGHGFERNMILTIDGIRSEIECFFCLSRFVFFRLL